MNAKNPRLSIVAVAVTLVCVPMTGAARAQPAPVPYAVTSADAAPESMSAMLDVLEAGERTIQIDDALWLQLHFSAFELGDDGTLEIKGADGETQTFNQGQLEAWEGLTAVFNGSEVTVTLSEGATAEIGQVYSGLVPTGTPDTATPVEIGPEAICGPNDDRVAANDPATGRIMPIGCTGWIIDGGALLTAGHCISGDTRTVEFNVPPSRANGTTVSPPVRDQYRVITASIVHQDTGVGNDWAVFRVLPNTQTGLMPIAAQGDSFQISNTANPNDVRITGYGVDGPAPGFGNPPPFNADNQTQQTHTGELRGNTGGANAGTLRYRVDTQGGNSGSPVIVEGSRQTIGIHTNGGCGSGAGTTNAGTSFRNQTLWAAANQSAPVVVSVVNQTPGRLRHGETAQLVATVTQGGSPLPGVAVAFASSDPNLATVAPATTLTDAMGAATATVTSQASSSGSVVITATSNGESGGVTVQVPDLSTTAFAVLLLGILALGLARLRRREV